MMNFQPLSELELKKIKRQINKSTGVNLEDFKTPFLTRRINARMMAKGIRSGSEYSQLLEADPLEPLSFYHSLSINVTTCFRDPNVWEIFMNETLPQIIQNSTDSNVQIWSAGCATGQEPYSLAMMFANSINPAKKSFKITATDMNKVSINIAKTGKYDYRSLKHIPKILLQKFVKKIDDDLYEILPELRNYINFSNGDILSYKIQNLDLIVCRNLLIYYGRDAQELLFQKFHSALNKKGILVLGMDESMIGTLGVKLFDPIYPRQRIFQKI